MRRTSLQLSTDRRRLLALLLTIIAHALIVYLLLRINGTPPPPPRDTGSLSTFDVTPSPQAAPSPGARPKSEAKPRETASAGRPPPPVQPPKAEAAKPPPTSEWQWGPKDLFSSADISKLPSRTTEGRAEGDAAGDGAAAGDSVAAYGPGAGPGGQRLYNAEWYVRPAQSQLGPYMPSSAKPGDKGTIACRTIPDFRVENCQSLGDQPLGSGVSRAMRQAAWQFRVRPPRIGGKSMVGAWVRIEITITPAGGAMVKGGD